MSVYEFGEELLSSKDLDPVYVLLWEAGLPRPVLERWLIAYWAFYHVGTASWITDQPDYWGAFRRAAESKEWPRSSERRHFRGENARKSTDYLVSRGLPGLYGDILGPRVGIGELMATVQRKWVGFGPWIAFKIGDMLERLGLREVSFDDGAMFLFDSPKEGAQLVYEMEDCPEDVVGHLVDYFSYADAPPRYERKVNCQEVETTLCKFKSYMGGHYHLGEDIESCRRGLLRFSRSKTAQALFSAGRKSLW